MANQKTGTAEREIVITRLLKAPRELVFKVWTDPKHVVNWWGPNGFTNTIHSMDVKPGGIWNLTMHGPDGVNYPNKIIYKKVVEPERLEYSHGSDDPAYPEWFEVIVTFETVGKQTRLTMKSIFATKKDRDDNVEKYGAIEGGNQTVDRLEKYLADMM